MTDINLSEEHELQVQAYLRFAKLKRDQHVRETISVISDFKSDKIIRGVGVGRPSYLIANYTPYLLVLTWL